MIFCRDCGKSLNPNFEGIQINSSIYCSKCAKESK